MNKIYFILVIICLPFFASNRNIKDLPSELHKEICLFLPYTDNFNMSIVNQYWYKLTKERLGKIIKKMILFNSFYLRTSFRSYLDKGYTIRETANRAINKYLKIILKKTPLLVGNSKFYRKCRKAVLNPQDEVRSYVVEDQLKQYCRLLGKKSIPIFSSSRSQGGFIVTVDDEIIINISSSKSLQYIKKFLKNDNSDKKIAFAFEKNYDFTYIDLHLKHIKNWIKNKKISCLDLRYCKEFKYIKNLDYSLFNNETLIKINKQNMNNFIKKEKENLLNKEQQKLSQLVRSTKGFGINAYKCGFVETDMPVTVFNGRFSKANPIFNQCLREFHEQQISICPYVDNEKNCNILNNFLEAVLFVCDYEAGHKNIKCCKKFLKKIGNKLIVPYFLELKNNGDTILQEVVEEGFSGILDILNTRVKEAYEKYDENLLPKLIDYIIKNSFETNKNYLQYDLRK